MTAGAVEGGIWAAESAARRAPDAGPVTATRFVLVHGSLDRSAGLLKLSRRLTGSGPVLRYDRRGYGRSAPHEGPFTMADQVDDALAVLDRFDDGRPWVVIGHSYGGNVALSLAAASARIAAVVTYEPPLSWMPWWPHATAGGEAVRLVESGGLAVERALAGPLDGDDDRDGDAAEAFMRRLIGDDRWERMPAERRAARRREGRALVAELVDLRRAAPWQVDAIRVPVLAMAGEASREHHRRAAREVAELIGDAEHAELPGASHFGPNTHPDATAAQIGGFLSRRGLG